MAQVTGLMDAFLTEDASGMASDVAASRKRPSPSCEAGQLTIAESLGGAAALPSAIADIILKKGLCHSLSGDPLLNRVLKCARLAPENYAALSRQDIGGRYLDHVQVL